MTAEVPFHQPLNTEPWGAGTFVVSDPDENLILFAGPEANGCLDGEYHFLKDLPPE